MGHFGLEHSTTNSNMFADDVCIVAMHVLHYCCSTFTIDLMIQTFSRTAPLLSLLTSNFSILTMDDLLLVVCIMLNFKQLICETLISQDLLRLSDKASYHVQRMLQILIPGLTKQISVMHLIVWSRSQRWNALSTFGMLKQNNPHHWQYVIILCLIDFLSTHLKLHRFLFQIHKTFQHWCHT